MDRHNILIPLREADLRKIRTALKRRRFEFAERDHAYFTASKGTLHVTVYKKGPKALVQGNEARDFVNSVLLSVVDQEVKGIY
jgi:ribonuclease HIII